MRGLTTCLRAILTYADALLVLCDEERMDFGLANAYGQTIPEWKFEDLVEFRKFYSAELPKESTNPTKKA